MAGAPPVAELATHAVTNQPPDYGGVDLFATDAALAGAALREGGDWVGAPLHDLGREAGGMDLLALGEAANRHPPELAAFDRYGQRLDEVRFHPAYHALMATAMRHGIHDVGWRAGRTGGHVLHAAMLAIFTQAEAGVMCPVSMTYASVPALRHAAPAVRDLWIGRIVGGAYDAPLRPVADKRGATVGMAMTEKQGGSDVRANTTRAEPDGADGAVRLVGHKWFCSAPMSDGFLTLAQEGAGQGGAGLSCYLVPRILPDGTRNAIQLQRLKDKLGNRSNASAEIEYHGAWALPVGVPGRGVATIIEMVHHTRLDTLAGTLGIMRAALARAAHHAAHRRAFQRRLIDQPAMAAVLADLAVEYEAAAVLVMRLARAFDAADGGDAALARLGVALGKFWLTRRCPGFVAECLECLGGAGYIEESTLPRLYREAPLNAIWEGSGNVIALDVLRTLARQPAAAEALLAEAAAARGGHPALDAAAAALASGVAGGLTGAVAEGDARLLAEQAALVLQGALLVRHAPGPVADAFCASRLAGRGGRAYGTLAGADVPAIVARLGSV